MKITSLLCLALFLIIGCGRLDSMQDTGTTPAPVVISRNSQEETPAVEESASEAETEPAAMAAEPERTPVKVKGIYISAYVAGTPTMVETLLEEIDKTEVNALVIDLKDDFGRVVCSMDSPVVTELGSVKVYISDMKALMQKLKEHDIYTIARIPAFRDSWLGEQRPEWCLQKSDGTLFVDRDGNSWANPYKQEVWDYLAEIGMEARRMGFDEVQFDYVRFCTESRMQDVVFNEGDVNGRSRTDIICEFVEYEYNILKAEGLFVSADVFGAIINSGVNADSVGQIYGDMAKHLDYISPMIYPSHYADGNFGIEHPDTEPYQTIMAALNESKKELYYAAQESDHIAVVRPWLQDFTATWLEHYIPYKGKEVRAQIQACYDAGYDEWLLWDASCKYEWDGLLTPQEAEAEAQQIAQSRAALPETTYAPEQTKEAIPEMTETETADGSTE
ncbi:MAG: putative glycoside hydrolase [Lachnospiraceae bacterium]